MKKLFTILLVFLLTISATFAQSSNYRRTTTSVYPTSDYHSSIYSTTPARSNTTSNTRKVSVPNTGNNEPSVATRPTKPTKHYYINSQGQRVQSPTRYSSVPTGATARCKDGTYSFSKKKKGTCSRHGGVAEWL